MRRLRPVLTIVAALLLATSPVLPAQNRVGTGRPDTRIDPALRAILDTASTARVIVLGRTQLFDPVNGLSQFQRTHDRDDRRAVRSQVMATLKRQAAAEQARILAALGRDRADRALWIVNALSLELSAADIERASRLDEVQYLYAGGERLADAPRGPLSPILLVPDEAPPPFTTDGKQIAWNVAHLNAPRAWRELGTLGRGAVIAVLDNGANYAHTDLRHNLWRNRGEIANNGRDDDGNGWVDDVYGYDFGSMRANVRNIGAPRQHGTMTSGIALGDGSGGTITGVAPRAQLMLLQITGGNVDESGSRPIAAALAYEYALEQGADVLSMSFSLPGLGNLRGFWRMMSDHAVAGGLLLVGGAGNFRTTQPLPVQHQSPKDVPSVISVGGIDTLNVLRPFSSMGPAEWSTVALYGDYPLPEGLIKPDLVAYPGEGFPVLGLRDQGYIDTDTVRIRGNSFAGPQVAGVAALIMAEFPSLSVWRVRDLIESTAHDLGAPGKDNQFGHGRVDAFAAVQRARALMETLR
jgi:subtilisin family serine protease